MVSFLFVNPFLEIKNKRNHIIKENLLKTQEYLDLAKKVESEIKEMRQNIHLKKIEVSMQKDEEFDKFTKDEFLAFKKNIEKYTTKEELSLTNQIESIKINFLKNFTEISEKISNKIPVKEGNQAIFIDKVDKNINLFNLK